MDDRITELETRVAFQDSALQELNDVVIQQQQIIEQMARELAALREHIKTLTPSNIAAAEEEPPPPHY